MRIFLLWMNVVHVGFMPEHQFVDHLKELLKGGLEDGGPRNSIRGPLYQGVVGFLSAFNLPSSFAYWKMAFSTSFVNSMATSSSSCPILLYS